MSRLITPRKADRTKKKTDDGNQSHTEAIDFGVSGQ